MYSDNDNLLLNTSSDSFVFCDLTTSSLAFSKSSVLNPNKLFILSQSFAKNPLDFFFLCLPKYKLYIIKNIIIHRVQQSSLLN